MIKPSFLDANDVAEFVNIEEIPPRDNYTWAQDGMKSWMYLSGLIQTLDAKEGWDTLQRRSDQELVEHMIALYKLIESSEKMITMVGSLIKTRVAERKDVADLLKESA